MVSSSLLDENSSIRVIGKEIAQAKTIIKEVDSHLKSNVIDLDDKDEDDRIPLKEILSRV